MDFPREESSSAAGTVLTEGSPGWCGKHAPTKAGYCEVHPDAALWERHDEKIFARFGVAAIFYCPRPTCDFFAWDTRNNSEHLGEGFCMKRELPYTQDNLAIGHEIFVQDVRLTILLLKQRQLIERLEKAGVFAGGKKI